VAAKDEKAGITVKKVEYSEILFKVRNEIFLIYLGWDTISLNARLT